MIADRSSFLLAIVPALGSPTEVRGCVEALRAAGSSAIRVLDDAPEIAEAVRRSESRFFLFVLPPARIAADLPERYLAALAADPHAAVAYGDYQIVRADKPPTRQTVLADPADLSEWSSWGYVRAFRRDAWLEVGGHGEPNRFAADYDLRLKLGTRWGFARIADALYDLPWPLAPETASRLRPYFAAESSAVPGFGYLFQPEEDAVEIERAFLAALSLRGARLEHAPSPVSCPHAPSSPSVSVVIPTLDRASLLERAIESVRSGDHQDFEILVVDNGSRDGTLELVERLSTRDARVRLLDNRERGTVASALNRGIQAARGRYVSQLDSDDEYVPSTLVEQVAALEDHPDWAAAISYYEVVDEEGRPLPEIGIVRHLEYDRNSILRTSGAGAVRTWHRCVLERLGGFDEEFGSYAEDYDLILRTSEQYTVGRVHQVLYRVRRHGGNTAARFSVESRATRKIEARRRALVRRRELNARLALAREN